MSLKIINLGGVSVQRNMFVYETPDEAIIFDCGIGFPEVLDYGVDILIPDFTYLYSIKDKIKGLVLTHGHDDHYSATPFLLQQMPLKIYAHPLVREFLKNKIEDFKDLKDYSFTDIAPGIEFTIGKNFKIIPYRVNHSVPNTLGFYVITPFGTVVHQSDFKFDFTPVMDKPADVREIASLSKQYKPVLMLSDGLGSTSDGFTETEMKIEETFDSILSSSQGKQVFITTLSSNISRIQQAINSAKKFGRKVVISGRSVEQNVEVAVNQGLIKNNDIVVQDFEAKKLPPDSLLYILPGTYGQENSGLSRVAEGRHKQIKLKEGAVVVFSGDPIPGMEAPIDTLIEKLVLRGAEVVYSQLQDDLHVSGHGSRGDLSLMAHLVNPKYLCPIGSSIKHIRAYRDLMVDSGFNQDQVIELLDGDSMVIQNNTVKKGDSYPIKEIYVDNNQTKTLVGDIVINDRKLMSESGVIFVVLPTKGGRLSTNTKPEIYTRGYIYVKENQSLLNGMKNNVESTVKSFGKDSGDIQQIKKSVEKSLNKHLYKRVGEVPIIVVETLEL